MLQTTAQTARKYGVIKAELEARGERIPDNDIWIAALAMEHQIPLASRDQHFERISGLSSLKW